MQAINSYIKLMKHFIGLDRKKPNKRHNKLFYRPYRNYYVSGESHEDLDLMVDAGYAERGEANGHGGYTYYLTRAGLNWLGEKLGIRIYDEDD